jgi:hypothetical protein
MLYVGLDILDKRIAICILGETGQIVRRAQVRTIDEMMRILTLLRCAGVVPPGRPALWTKKGLEWLRRLELPQRKKIALVATAHYLVRVMWALLKRGTDWEEGQALADEPEVAPSVAVI